MTQSKAATLAPVVLRLGLVILFIWFGTNELLNPARWTSFIPAMAASLTGLTKLTLVYINGVFEIIMALLLAFGRFTRVVAGLLAIHMLLIVADVGFNAIGMRDLAIFFALLSVTLAGGDTYTLDFARTKTVGALQTGL